MMRAAVVDDEQNERDNMLLFFRRFQEKLHEEVIVDCFASGEEFLAGYVEAYDLICLDIDMKGQDGISTAKEIRKKDSQVIIIFITNMAQMAIRGYEVQALDFVLKPMNYDSFAMKMQNAFQRISSRRSRNIVIPIPGGIQRISTDELYYAEVNGHYLYYHVAEGVFRQKASMKELEEKLAGLPFKRCNNCYLINLKHVDCVNKDDLRVGGEWLKISRPRKKEFLQALANYMGGIGI